MLTLYTKAADSKAMRRTAGVALLAGLAALAAFSPAAAAGDEPDPFAPPAQVAAAVKAAAPAQVAPPADAPAKAEGSVMRAGFETPADDAGPAGAGIVRTSAETPARPARAGLGTPAADLDFFLKPRTAARPAPPAKPVFKPAPQAQTNPGANPGAEQSVKRADAAPDAAPQPQPQPQAQPQPAAGPTGFSAADFGFGPAVPAAPAAPRTAEAAGSDIPAAFPAATPASPAVRTAGLSEDADEAGALGARWSDDGAVVQTAGAVPADADAADPFAVSEGGGFGAGDADPFGAPRAVRAAAGVRTDRQALRVAPVPVTRGSVRPAAAVESAAAVPAAGAVTAQQYRNAPAEARGPRTAAVTVRWERSAPVRVGRVCTCVLVVENAGPAEATDVEVVGSVSANLGLSSAAPAPASGAGTVHPVWTFASIPAGEARRIVLTHSPVGTEGTVLAASVRSRVTTLDAVTVTEPKLEVTLEGPREVTLGDPAAQTIVVSNPGSGAVDEVVIEALLPEGLEYRGGPKRLSMSIGRLAAGETKPVRLGLIATAGGTQTVVVTVRGDAGLRAEAEAPVAVKSPMVELAVDGPSLRYVNRAATVTLTVTNPGDGATDNVRLGYRVPEGFTFVSADRSGTHDAAGRTVRWFLGRVEPGGTVAATVTLKASAPGEQVHRAEVSASGQATATAEHVTEVAGTASLVLNITDTDDPVEVGAETDYTVTVANEGTAPAKTVGLACKVPAGTEVVSIRGPAAYRTEGNLILFDSLPSLAPGQKSAYRVRVRGTAAGSKRFQTRLVSESISEPLIHEEITKFYAE